MAEVSLTSQVFKRLAETCNYLKLIYQFRQKIIYLLAVKEMSEQVNCFTEGVCFFRHGKFAYVICAKFQVRDSGYAVFGHHWLDTAIYGFSYLIPQLFGFDSVYSLFFGFADRRTEAVNKCIDPAAVLHIVFINREVNRMVNLCPKARIFIIGNPRCIILEHRDCFSEMLD